MEILKKHITNNKIIYTWCIVALIFRVLLKPPDKEKNVYKTWFDKYKQSSIKSLNTSGMNLEIKPQTVCQIIILILNLELKEK
jgi:hypothetical protein